MPLNPDGSPMLRTLLRLLFPNLIRRLNDTRRFFVLHLRPHVSTIVFQLTKESGELSATLADQWDLIAWCISWSCLCWLINDITSLLRPSRNSIGASQKSIKKNLSLCEIDRKKGQIEIHSRKLLPDLNIESIFRVDWKAWKGNENVKNCYSGHRRSRSKLLEEFFSFTLLFLRSDSEKRVFSMSTFSSSKAGTRDCLL